MPLKTVLYLHGFASSAYGTKAQFFREKFGPLPEVEFRALDFNPTPTDFEYLTITGMINRLRQYVFDHDLGSLGIIASSLGALVGLHYAHRFGGVERMLLLAPALAWRSHMLSGEDLRRWEEAGAAPVLHYAFEHEVGLRYDFHVDRDLYRQPVPPPAPITIIHGVNDDTVPIEGSRRYAAAFPNQVRLVEVDSDHRLNDRLPLIWAHCRSFLLNADSPP